MLSGATGGETGTAASGVALPSGLPLPRLLAPGAGSGTATVDPSGVRVPSKLTAAGDRPKARPSKPMLRMKSDVRIARLLGGGAGMGDRASARRPHLLRVFPQISRCGGRLARLPRLGEIGRAHV